MQPWLAILTRMEEQNAITGYISLNCNSEYYTSFKYQFLCGVTSSFQIPTNELKGSQLMHSEFCPTLMYYTDFINVLVYLMLKSIKIDN